MKTYFQKGVVKDGLCSAEEEGEFYLQELGGETGKSVTYPGDAINYLLDNELCALYDTFRDLIFEDTEEYYQELSVLPIWVQEAGQNSDCGISAGMFGDWLCDSKAPNLYKHLYLVDCQFLVGTVQNLLSALENSFIGYYKTISISDNLEQYEYLTDPNGTIFLMSQNVTFACSLIETYFTKAYSILDIICKICYEMQFMYEDLSEYRKTKSADKLWGARKTLIINGCLGTLFEKCEFISTIEALRNELVHNGTWELNPKKFVRFSKGEVCERFMLFPDMDQGHLSTVKNRKHFFSLGVKVNDILPEIHSEFKSRLLKTIEVIKELYNVRCEES